MDIRKDEIYRLGELYELNIPKTNRGPIGGEVLGEGTGSSLEFQDYRPYVPGDDLRHLDWRAYGRSDSLMVRLFREEIQPMVEIIVDGSRSMKITSEKKQRVWELALLLSYVAQKKFPIRLLFFGREVEIFDSWNPLLEASPQWEGQTYLEEELYRCPALYNHSMRFVISDFLFPSDYRQLGSRLARKASTLNYLQVLSPREVEPPQKGRYELVDTETGARETMIIDEKSRQRYRERLRGLQTLLSENARKCHGRHLTFITSHSLTELSSQVLVANQIFQTSP